jgi:hypothetical protein
MLNWQAGRPRKAAKRRCDILTDITFRLMKTGYKYVVGYMKVSES